MAPSRCRLTTWEFCYPRFVHSELMTHRLFSRNAASSRAIPIEKFIERVLTDPAMFVFWGKNQAGMQSSEEVAPDVKAEAIAEWLRARDSAVGHARNLQKLGLHKQIVNRVLEPWLYITTIVSATTFSNFFHLRDHKDAQAEIAWVGSTAHQLYDAATPIEIPENGWHLPFIYPEDLILCSDENLLKQISTGRCARVSYLTHEGKRDHSKDIELHNKLMTSADSGDPGHWSPFEHPAMALATKKRSGNFIGWEQYRKTFPNEHFGEMMP